MIPFTEDDDDSTKQGQYAALQALSAQSQPQDSVMMSYVNAPTTAAAYASLPATAAPQQSERSGGFDWGRALTALGGGDIGSYDARHNRIEEAPQRAFAFQRAQREAAFEDQQRAEQQRVLQESLNPQSKASRNAQQQFRDSMNTVANLPGMTPQAQAQFASYAEKADSMSAAEIAKAQLSIQPLVGNVLRAAGTQATQDLAGKKMDLAEQQLAATVANQGSGRALQGAALQEDIRHHQAMESAPIQARISQGKADQDKLNKEINDIDFSIDQMNKIEALKGKVNTGPLSGRLQGLLSKVDLSSGEFNELKSLTSRVFNKETKTLAGSAVSPSEWARIEPQIPDVNDDDKLYKSKLKTAIESAKSILEKRREEYRMKGGAPLDQSVTAQKNNPALPGNTNQSSVPNQIERSGQNEAALKWIAEHPDDPRVPAIKKKLGI